ncbi:hypothetical protein OH76DRAFT_137803 [Lentinus brumalis]|uniref:Uncharacterized protein n=1 Tax=Lentinus brumalis TaxID=2498619 RepID=A0A371CPJ0_9APHY|nr:hypothetical protein OH76DRAFT_137803 [Polyporus brumalis]
MVGILAVSPAPCASPDLSSVAALGRGPVLTTTTRSNAGETHMGSLRCAIAAAISAPSSGTVEPHVALIVPVPVRRFWRMCAAGPRRRWRHAGRDCAEGGSGLAPSLSFGSTWRAPSSRAAPASSHSGTWTDCALDVDLWNTYMASPALLRPRSAVRC